MRKTKTAALALALTIPALPSQAQSASWGCVYMIITHAHAAIAACGVPLDKEHEANYLSLQTGLEQFIRASAGSNPDGLLMALKRSAQLHPQENPCESSWKQSLENLTSTESTARIQAAMKIPGDPMKGGCI